MVGCSDNDDENDVIPVEDNYYQEDSDVGYNSVTFELPDMPRLEDVKEHIYINLEMSGVEDHENYIVPVKLSIDDGKMTAEAITGIINTMPHQDYYLNGVIYPEIPVISRSIESSIDGGYDTRLGVLISMDDPNSIALSDELVIDGDSFKDSNGNVVVNITGADDLFELARQYDLYSGDEVECIYRQTALINLYGYVWSPIGSRNLYTTSGVKPFTQTYDGNGYDINHMSSYELEATALFSTLGDGAVIKNLAIENTSITSHSGSASLASYVDAGSDVNIENFYLDGCTVQGIGNVGGAIGENRGTITFNNCAGEVDVYFKDDNSDLSDNTTSHLGGFVGYNEGTLTFTDCAYYGTIEDTDLNNAHIGGYVGNSNGGKITFSNCTTGGYQDGFLYGGGFIGYAHNTTISATDCTVGRYNELSMINSNKSTTSYSGDSVTVTREMIDSRLIMYLHSRSCYAAGVIGYDEGCTISKLDVSIYNSTTTTNAAYKRCVMYKDSSNTSSHITNYVANQSDSSYSQCTGSFTILY